MDYYESRGCGEMMNLFEKCSKAEKVVKFGSVFPMI